AVLQIEAKVLPTWTDKYRSGAGDVYAIVPLTGDLENNPAPWRRGTSIGRARHWNTAKNSSGRRRCIAIEGRFALQFRAEPKLKGRIQCIRKTTMRRI
ncbi:MAG: hypothetical protein LBS24_04810, partial [Clostridiales Family XIII bacterium]|nr:hypothetical protein [Clostridiales Family XIII bacterium]